MLDIEIYQQRQNQSEIEGAGGDSSNKNIQRGTKDLMAAIRAGIDGANEEDIEDVEPTEE